MIRYKFFKLGKVKDDEFNNFIASVDVAKEGVVFRGDYVIVAYFEKYDGLRPDDMIESLKNNLTAMQGDILSWYIDLQALLDKKAWFEKNPDAPKMLPSPSEIITKVDTFTKRISDHKDKMESIRNLIAKIKSGEVVI